MFRNAVATAAKLRSCKIIKYVPSKKAALSMDFGSHLTLETFVLKPLVSVAQIICPTLG